MIEKPDKLAAALREVSEDTSCYHVIMDNNNFSNCVIVIEVIGDVMPAGEPPKAANPATAEKIKTRLSWLMAMLQELASESWTSYMSSVFKGVGVLGAEADT